MPEISLIQPPWMYRRIRQPVSQSQINCLIHKMCQNFLVGDDALSLHEWMMKPFLNRGQSYEEQIFNYQLFWVRQCKIHLEHWLTISRKWYISQIYWNSLHLMCPLQSICLGLQMPTDHNAAEAWNCVSDSHNNCFSEQLNAKGLSYNAELWFGQRGFNTVKNEYDQNSQLARVNIRVHQT